MPAGARETFSDWEKVAAERPDEGLRPSASLPDSSPVAFGDTLSLWERGR
jgi:hypothetical protein